jgi:DNA mismatch endonuclease (patch repair protein)
MTDFLTPKQRSRRMAAVRTAGTEPERAVRRILRTLGVRFRTNAARLPGKPDLVVLDRRWVLFVHGCFWHAHTCRHGRVRPQTRTSFWNAKLAANRARDRRNQRDLRKLGWHVLVVWQCQLRDEPRLRARLRRHLLAQPQATGSSSRPPPPEPSRSATAICSSSAARNSAG